MPSSPSLNPIPSQNKTTKTENVEESSIVNSIQVEQVTNFENENNLDIIKSSSTSSSELILSLELPKQKISYFEYYIGLIGLIIMGILLLFFKKNYGLSRFYNVLLLITAICVLIGASNLVLENAVKLAESVGVPEIIIGLTLVSIGTSIPEIFTAILASKQGAGAIAIGDIYGSYITQLTLFLGIVILVIPGTVERAFIPHVRRDAGLMILALLFLSLHLIDGVLSRVDAVISIAIFLLYNIYLFVDAKKNPVHNEEKLYTTLETEKSMGIHPDKAIYLPIQKIPSKGKKNLLVLLFIYFF